jgi:two-component system, OmpR family, flagellar system response regulator FtcR
MIILVESRADIAEAYKTTIGREGVPAIVFSPDEFNAWFLSTDEVDLASIEAVVLGDFERRENVTRCIKSRSAIPALALTDAAALETTLKLFQAGVDDVVRKPVHAREILARVNAVRRRNLVQAQALWDADGFVVFGDGRDPMVNGTKLQLPRRERRILDYLASCRGRRVTRAQIFSAIYGVLEEGIEECVIESHISKLRKKLRSYLGYDPIDTQRYLGYQFVGKMQNAA